jgi:hypothetical protein
LARSWWRDDLRLLNHLATMILPKNIFKSLALFPCLVAACPRCEEQLVQSILLRCSTQKYPFNAAIDEQQTVNYSNQNMRGCQGKFAVRYNSSVISGESTDWSARFDF